MLFVALVVLIIVVVCQFLKSYGKSINLINPMLLFSIIWLMIITLYEIRAYGLNSASIMTETIIFWGIIGMELGLFVGIYCRVGKKKRQIILHEMSTKVYVVFSAILIIVLTITSLKSILLLANGVSLGQIRYLERENVFSSPIIDILYNYYAVPMSYLMMHINIKRLFTERNKVFYFIYLLFIVIGCVLSEGGRFIIYFASVDALVLLIYYLRNKRPKISAKTKKIGLISIILCIAGFVFITKDRGADVYKTIYTYLCGCVPYLSKKIETFDTIYDNTFLFTSLNGFIRPLFVVLERFGIGLPNILTQVEDILLDVELHPYNIGNNIVYNGFVTMFYSFYVDLGVMGVFLGSLVFGWSSGVAYKKIIYNEDERELVVFLLFVQYIFMSMMRFFGTSYNFALCLVYLIILYRSHRLMGNEEMF